MKRKTKEKQKKKTFDFTLHYEKKQRTCQKVFHHKSSEVFRPLLIIHHKITTEVNGLRRTIIPCGLFVNSILLKFTFYGMPTLFIS